MPVNGPAGGGAGVESCEKNAGFSPRDGVLAVGGI